MNHGTERSVAALRPHDRNARTHSKRQIEQIADSIRRFGFTNPVLVDAEDRIIAGHGRVAAAKELGLTRVPVIAIEGMSEAERRAYILADNRLAELAGWDDDLLRLELGEILELEPDFDLALTGFEGAALEGLLDVNIEEEAEAVVSVDETAPVVTRSGDLWLLGNHRLICGDARDAEV
tara:strand:+ start:1663 stop:2199 length:537 start_codon:yes stop_codon:yes gene_type:complete